MNDTGYFMPGEWAKHERTLISWPVKDSLVWTDNYEEVCNGYEEVINAIAEFEAVTVIANDSDVENLKNRLNDKVHILIVPHNDAWCRDNGPTFVWNNQKDLKGINWKFNAWGEKYAPYDLDDKAASAVLTAIGVPVLHSSIVLEGGSIHVDGEGTMLTTKQCLLNKNRNPHLTQKEIEEELKDKLRIEKIIWLNQGLFGDETDGHIDNIACFARPGEVIIQTCKDKEDPNYEITQENLKILQEATDSKGRKLKIMEIPQPPARFYKGVRLTLSYLNFYFVNGGIILPVFGGDAAETDYKAREILQKEFPDRKIVTVDGMALIKEGGNVHCITQQMPAGKY
ncbi:putative agmatine deiminase [Anaerocolumna cellulosilytica]|uniref:Putative agmatine deiminase n=1 Tax=Anaerocolumna cellulosilytica TaxID=433286 RepID=A0A6S6QXR6_9FIRM|nr:agmatine deiminase family protein [Anaerocolumna cellulosilytica]MBB5194271.1 agmatine deiminase [Anaerocolumna cellulosilytica]BCJ94516.1 putative agmatine deiminase [Anaerocolumna cellulosilytica]